MINKAKYKIKLKNETPHYLKSIFQLTYLNNFRIFWKTCRISKNKCRLRHVPTESFDENSHVGKNKPEEAVKRKEKKNRNPIFLF